MNNETNSNNVATPAENEMRCPRCGTILNDEENLVHDGYSGSPHAHGGRGSYGMGRHHYFFACECGWAERKVKKANTNPGRGRQKFDGLKLPAGTGDILECVQLRPWSRQTKADKLALQLARAEGRVGSITGHSLCASYTYELVPAEIFARICAK